VEEERKDPSLVALRIEVAEWLLRVIPKTDFNNNNNIGVSQHHLA
jgi:hypothetical protein